MSIVQSVFFFISGALLWTLMEYLLHRFLGHVKKRLLVRTRFHKEHSKHHLMRDYFASLSDKILMLMIASPILFFLSLVLLEFWFSLSFTLGFGLMYLTYEWVHLRLHVAPPPHRYASLMRAHHFYHHFEDESMNHGVTTPLWDKVFGTYRTPGVVTYPSKFHLSWIPQSPSGLFQDPWGQHYQRRVEKDDQDCLQS